MILLMVYSCLKQILLIMDERMILRRRSQLKPPDRFAGYNGEIENTPKTVEKKLEKKPKKTVKRKKIPIDYGPTSPRTDINLNPRITVKPLPPLVENQIKEGCCSFILQDDKILPKQSHCFSNGELWIFLATFGTLVVIAGLMFFLMQTNFFETNYQENSLTFLKTLPSSELTILPNKNSIKEASVPSKLKTNEMTKQNLKRNLFIAQECSNSDRDDFHYNYALKSNGARILSTVDTEPYGENYMKIKFLGVNLGPLPNFILPQHAYDSSGPSALLEGPITPGQCWAFKGTRGRTRILLAKSIVIKAIAIEQLPGNFNSAPRFFSIMGIDFTDNKQEIRTHLGTFEFEKNGQSLQYFELNSDEASFPFRIIEFHVTANHGNKDFTCVYRLRVYGNV